jgi:hypothetical protein
LEPYNDDDNKLRGFCYYTKLLSYLVKFLLEHGGLASRCVDFLDEDLRFTDEILLARGTARRLVLVADLVPLVLANYTPGAHIQLIILAEIFGFLLWMFQAEFFREVFLITDRGLHLILVLVQIVYMI